MTDKASKSVLISTVGQAPGAVDYTDIATALGLACKPVVTGEPELAAVVGSEPLADGPALLIGTGNTEFDAKAAATLGVALLLVSDHAGLHVDMAAVQATAYGAVVAGQLVGDEIDARHLKEAVDHCSGVAPVMGPEAFEHWLIGKAREKKTRIVLPEGDDDRILEAADILLKKDVCDLIILGDPETMTARAAQLGLDITKATLDDPAKSAHADDFAETFAELRKNKGVTLEQARDTMQDISYFATMMIYKGLADGMVSGAAHTTAHTIKPSFQIIKTKPGVSTVSSIFLMVLPGKLWAFGDCAVNPNPTAEQLGEIAAVSAETAAQFGIDPKVALLSYSTGTSGHGPDVDRAAQAVDRAREINPDLVVDGPLQFDAAVDEGVAAKKMPESDVAGHATVLIFPDLEAGNITYKAVQRTSGALAVGPILQGLKKPVNDLSRGATVPDIVNTVAITAIQAQGE
ncbi:phosphate acetyltransferase [Corynebacterium mendelii]|uniref:phosphate acetyltransferase n=1 Tax=Corynebacterium mendelii TaxID=2765362 RepID=UPI003630A9E0